MPIFDFENQSLTFKMIGNAKSSDAIDISKYINEYSELLLSVTLGNFPYRVTLNIPTAELVNVAITYQVGSYSMNNVGTVANVSCTREKVNLSAVNVNGKDVLPYSTIRIYAKK